MKGCQVELDFESYKRLQRYKNENSTQEKRLKIKELLSKAVNESLKKWETKDEL